METVVGCPWQVVRKRLVFRIAKRKYTKISKYRNMILSSLLTLLKINLSYLDLLVKQFITAIENIRFEIYLRFIWIQTYRSCYFSRRLIAKHHTHKFLVSDFRSRSRSRELRISSIIIFFVNFFHSDIDFTRNRGKFCGDQTGIKSLLRRLKNIGTVCEKLYRNTLGCINMAFGKVT